MNSDIFVDGVINIALVKGMIRVEFGSYSASEKGADGNPAIFNKYQLVLTRMNERLQLRLTRCHARSKKKIGRDD